MKLTDVVDATVTEPGLPGMMMGKILDATTEDLQKLKAGVYSEAEKDGAIKRIKRNFKSVESQLRLAGIVS